MNCQVAQDKRLKCTCCEDCLKAKGLLSQKSSHVPRGYETRAGQYSNAKSSSSYVASDDKCHTTGRSRQERPSACQCKHWMDPKTLQALSQLRQRACQFLDNAPSSGPSENECLRSSPGPWNDDSPVRKTARSLNYSPQSNFLKRIKKHAESSNGGGAVSCGCPKCTPDGDTYQRDSSFQCCKCAAKAPSVTHREEALYWRSSDRDRGYSDISSVHCPCTCFRTWRSKEQGHQQSAKDEMSELCKETAKWFDRLESQEKLIAKENEAKTGHISRPTRRKGRGRRRKRKSKHGFCDSPLLDFEPTLKRPHPNSCERCWRFASASRSPVNKPSQRFDPNFRKSQSEVDSAESIGSIPVCICSSDRETIPHELESNDSILLRCYSADNVKKKKPEITIHIAKQPKKHSRKTVPENMNKAPNIARSPRSRGDGSPKASSPVDKCRTTEKKSVPVQTCPKIRKKARKSPKSGSVPRELVPQPVKKSPSPPRPASACPTPYSDSIPRGRPRLRPVSFDMGAPQYPAPGSHKCQMCSSRNQPSRSCQKPAKEEISSQSQTPRKCDCARCLVKAKKLAGCAGSSYDITKSAKCHSRSHPVQEHRSHDHGKANQDPFNCGYGFSDLFAHRSAQADGVRPHRSSERDSSRESPVTLWDRQCKERIASCRCKHTHGKGKNESGSSNSPNNPRKYCVFYMTKGKENNDKNNVEVLIEELTRGKCGRKKESKSESLEDRMKKISGHRSDSMALRYQKGIPERCRKPETNRVIYF